MKRKYWSLALILILTLSLSGCVKMEIGVQVNMDESGALALTIGLSKEMMTFLDSSIEGLLDELLEDMNEDKKEKFEVETWTDDEYEYLEASAAFADLDELHEMIQDTDFFESFSLTTNSTFFSKEFYLDARLIPMEEIFSGMQTEDLGEFDLDAGDMIEVTIVALDEASWDRYHGICTGGRPDHLEFEP